MAPALASAPKHLPSTMTFFRQFLLTCLGLTLGQEFAAATTLPPGACGEGDGDGQPVIQAAMPPLVPAQAHWLSRGLIVWPGLALPAGGRFLLAHSPTAPLPVVRGLHLARAVQRLPLKVVTQPLPPTLAERFKWLAPGPFLALAVAEQRQVKSLLRRQLHVLAVDEQGRVLHAAALQLPGVLDEVYAAAQTLPDLGATAVRTQARFVLWAPTARAVWLCLHGSTAQRAPAARALRFDSRTGAWQRTVPGDLAGRSYTYLVDVYVPGVGRVLNRVTDPYSASLTADSKRSVVLDLNDPATHPPGWQRAIRPAPLPSATDQMIYELHVRDFSAFDETVPPALRGKYLAFTQGASNGMRHLKALAAAGMTHVHLLPIFDFATVPESHQVTPSVSGPPDGTVQQEAVVATKERDAYNWGYDPLHFNAPEGSYASNAEDGAVRVRELRAMVMALHAAGLRVGMDVVYNHLSASGQHQHSVLDRIVPGYYHRLDANGKVETSTCCANSATEHRMMAKLMIDSAMHWVRHYRIDAFRFDLMGHQPRAAMVQLQAAVDKAAGRRVHLIGEGWNFGEVADGARFVQASQRSLNGSGIATFSDRGRDAVRGGGAGDDGAAQLERQGYVNGLFHDANEAANSATTGQATVEDLKRSADLVRLALAGSLRSYRLHTASGETLALERIPYANQAAGYASQPDEVVNYVENHDNQTLFDANVFKLPRTTSSADRARVQTLAAAVVAFSQGIAYFHAGQELLRSKSMDRNSHDSGDWFNRIDFSGQTNHFGSGLPPQADNGKSWPLMRPLLADAARVAPTPADIAFTREAFLDLLRIRASTTLLRLRSADEVARRLTFHNTGPQQNPVLIAGHLNGEGLPGAGFKELLYLINVDKQPHGLEVPVLKGRPFTLHPVHANGADARARESRFDAARGTFQVPARTAAVFVVD